MRHRFICATLASSVVFSLLLSGCATKHSPTSPTPSNKQQKDLSILKSALSVSSKQKYTQIAESGESSVGKPSFVGLGIPHEINQTIQVDGVVAKINQDISPSVYKSTNDLFYPSYGKWREYSSPEPSGNSLGWNKWTANQTHSLFKTFSVQKAGTNQLVFTIVPVDTYRTQFFGVVSTALHRVMIGHDPYNWTLSVGYLSNEGISFENETVKLTLTKTNGLWEVTGGTWDIAYTNSHGEMSKINLTESYQHQSIPVSIPENVLNGGTINIGKSVGTGTHTDGQIISLTSINPLDIPDFNTSLDAYEMTYWSQNIPVVAYVAVPRQSGTYPLYVECHGGWVAPMILPVTHVQSMGDIPLDGRHEISFARKNSITVAPMYRGYGDSQGLVSGLNENTVDTVNAIKAIEAKYKVETGHVYLQGTSMGGGVVLKVAGEQTGIRSVIAVSPYVGADFFAKWYLANSKDAMLHTKLIYTGLINNYGRFDPSKPTYQRESIDYKKIEAPTLLLQGTGDTKVQWQMVQALYKDMDADHKKVKFDLVKGANHGFMGSDESYQHNAVVLWYAKYGEGAS